MITRSEIEDRIRKSGSTKLDLAGQDFAGVDLSYLDFKGASLERAVFRFANCKEANFEKANISSANLQSADFRKANLSRCDMTNSDMTDANFRGANLSAANLTNAVITGATFAGAKCSKKTIWPLGSAPSGMGLIFDEECFIATAATGSSMTWQVYELRRFRDIVLERNYLGKKFIDWYYAWSPSIAEEISSNPYAKIVVLILVTFISAILVLVTQMVRITTLSYEAVSKIGCRLSRLPPDASENLVRWFLRLLYVIPKQALRTVRRKCSKVLLRQKSASTEHEGFVEKDEIEQKVGYLR